MNEQVFFKLLPVQIMIIAMGSINSIVDGIIAGRFIDATTVGVIGLFIVVVNIISAISSVILGGSSVLSGRYMGSGNLEKTNGIFSLNISVTTIVGLLLTIIMLLFPGPIASLCGADDTLRSSLMIYIMGFAAGVIPQLLAQQIAAFLQLERQSSRNYMGIIAMIVFNVAFNIIFVAVFNMGVLGLALSTSLCNWIYFIILATYYLGDKSQLRYSFEYVLWKDLPELIKIGSPGALLVFCLAIREILLNRIVLNYAGQNGLSAKASLGMVSCLFIALCLGAGSVIRMLASIYFGEEDKDSIRSLLKLSLTKMLLMSVGIAIIVALLSGLVVRIFFPDDTTTVYRYAHQYFIVYGLSIPLIMLVQIETNYLQALGKNVCVNIFSVIDGFVGTIIPAAILAPIIGPWGIWLATPIGLCISALVYPVYALIHWKRLPASKDEWLIFDKGFGVEDEDRLIMTIETLKDVSSTSLRAEEFCKEHNIEKKKAMYSALCLEEMTRNVVEHGFSQDDDKHYIDARIVYKDEKIILRIKDDCAPFDPVEMSKHLNADDITSNIGIRMVMQIAKQTSYQSMIGLNVLTIEV